MYNYGYDYITDSSANSVAGTLVWTIIAFVIAIAAGIMIYFMFVKSEKKVNANLQKLKNILDFKTMLIEPILKIVYIICTVFIVLFSFGLISTSFISFLLTLILGPIIIRIVYELALINVMIWKNTKEINESLKKSPKKEKEKETKDGK